MFDFNKETGEIFLYDDIGPDWLGMIGAGAVMFALSEIGPDKRVTARIASPGGFADEGIAIFNALERHRAGVDTAIDGTAASMGSYLAMVGEKITIAENGGLMIHDPLTMARGNSTELRKTADVLDKYRDRIIKNYQKRLGIDVDAVQALLTDETWYNAEEAVEAGLADEVGNLVIEDVAIVASGRYKNTPARLQKPAEPGSRTKNPFNRLEAEARARRFAALKR